MQPFQYPYLIQVTLNIKSMLQQNRSDRINTRMWQQSNVFLILFYFVHLPTTVIWNVFSQFYFVALSMTHWSSLTPLSGTIYSQEFTVQYCIIFIHIQVHNIIAEQTITHKVVLWYYYECLSNPFIMGFPVQQTIFFGPAKVAYSNNIELRPKESGWL